MRGEIMRCKVISGLCALAMTATGYLLTPNAAAASDYSFHVGYRGYLSGLQVGKGHLAGTFKDSRYRLNADGEISGLARLFSSYEGSSEAKGRLDRGATSYRARASGGGTNYSVRMKLAGEAVRDVEIDPAPPAHRANHPERVPVKGEHRRNIMDPLRALIAPGGFDGSDFDRAACERTIPVFSGSERFDIVLSFREIRSVASSRSNGYSGPVMVCSARYKPVAGHRNNNSTVRYLSDTATIEVMLAPVPDSDVLVPYRVTVSTPFGPAVIEAQNVVASGALATRAAAR